MRITGGQLKGRQVDVPDGVIRPAMDKMRESVFAILGDIGGRSFLDLFTGSGIIALEAASRQAKPIEAVESDPLKRSTLIANCSISPIRIDCRFMSVELYIKRAKRAWDYIFCDPPFPYQYKRDLLESISGSKLVHADTVIMIHRPKEEDFPDAFGAFLLSDRRRYGRSIVDFFENKPSP